MLAAYIPPCEDELLFSWLYRLMEVNCISNMTDFYKAFIVPSCGERYPYIKTDGRIKFPLIYKFMEMPQAMAPAYLNVTCYGGIAPMLSTEHQIKQTHAAFRPAPKGALTKTPLSLTPELRRCPACMAEDLESLGRWYYHRSHQMPGVYVCHRHGHCLEKYTGQPGHEFDAFSSFAPCETPCTPEVMLAIAKYAHELLDAAIDTNMEETKLAIMQEIKARGYYDPNHKYPRLSLELDQYGMSAYFKRGVAHYMQSALMHVSDASPLATIAMLKFLFGEVELFATAVKQFHIPKSADLSALSQCTVVGQRRNLLELICNCCGYHFCTTAEAVLRGWRCPQCDNELPPQTLFARLVALAGKGEYTLLSPFESMEKPVRIAHICGREYNVKPRRFVHDGSRCTCEGRRILQDAQNILGEIGSYALLNLDVNQEKITAINNCSGDIASCGLSVVSEQPWRENYAPRFAGTPEIFAARVFGLVGNEYTVTGQFTSYREKVVIRHNACGYEQEYYAHNFLYGQRCQHCRPNITPEYLRTLIPDLSGGDYVYGGSEGKGMIRLIQVHTHQETIMRIGYALQELQRPTPSRILPRGNTTAQYKRDEAICLNELQSGATKYHLFLDMLLSSYKSQKFIFLDEFATDPEAYEDAKHALEYLYDRCHAGSGYLDRIYPGIYVWPHTQYTPEEMLLAKYCKRRDSVIGYTYGRSFAYQLGLASAVPNELYLVTMKESKTHGRALKPVKGVQIHVRGSRAPITNDNYKVLQLLDVLPNLGQYIDCPRAEAIDILRCHAQAQGINAADAQPYLYLFPDWVPATVEKILRNN